MPYCHSKLKVCTNNHYTAMQSQKAVSAYFAIKQILNFGFAEQYMCKILVSPFTKVSVCLSDQGAKYCSSDNKSV